MCDVVGSCCATFFALQDQKLPEEIQRGWHSASNYWVLVRQLKQKGLSPTYLLLWLTLPSAYKTHEDQCATWLAHAGQPYLPCKTKKRLPEEIQRMTQCIQLLGSFVQRNCSKRHYYPLGGLRIGTSNQTRARTTEHRCLTGLACSCHWITRFDGSDDSSLDSHHDLIIYNSACGRQQISRIRFTRCDRLEFSFRSTRLLDLW